MARAVVPAPHGDAVHPDLGEGVGQQVAGDERQVADADPGPEVPLEHVALELVRAPAHRGPRRR